LTEHPTAVGRQPVENGQPIQPAIGVERRAIAQRINRPAVRLPERAARDAGTCSRLVIMDVRRRRIGERHVHPAIVITEWLSIGHTHPVQQHAHPAPVLDIGIEIPVVASA